MYLKLTVHTTCMWYQFITNLIINRMFYIPVWRCLFTSSIQLLYMFMQWDYRAFSWFERCLFCLKYQTRRTYSFPLCVKSSVLLRHQWYTVLDLNCRQQAIAAMFVADSCYIFKIFDDFHNSSDEVGNIKVAKFINTQSMRISYVFDEA